MPAGARLSRTDRRVRGATAAAAVCASLSVAACGALPPQAPVAAASLVSRALSTIASSCGESYRLQEFTPHPDLTGLEKTAGESARTLAGISVRHPQWVYQGATLSQIDTLSIQDLDGCSLPHAAAILRRTGQR